MSEEDAQLMHIVHSNLCAMFEGFVIWFTCCLLQCSLLLANTISVDDDDA